MKTKLIITTIVLGAALSSSIHAQIGINTTTPSATLDIVGDMKVEGRLFLENPGENNIIRNSKLLIKSTDTTIKKYDINISKYGPINYAQFIFNELSKDGLQDYDTGISTTNYMVSIQGYYFLEANTDDTNIILHSLNDNNNIEGYQIYAYANSGTGTWFIRAFGNDSEFMTPTGSGGGNNVGPTEIDLYLNVIIYRRGFIAKEQLGFTLSMGNSETGTAPLPLGF